MEEVQNQTSTTTYTMVNYEIYTVSVCNSGKMVCNKRGGSPLLICPSIMLYEPQLPDKIKIYNFVAFGEIYT